MARLISKRQRIRPEPYEHRGSRYRRLLTESAAPDQLVDLYYLERDPWLRKIFAERLLLTVTQIRSAELEQLCRLSVHDFER
jgi:hypothetical protein